MYYIGPSFMLGFDFQLKKKYLLSAYAQYFSRDLIDHRFQTWSLAILYQHNLGKKKRFYLGIGPAFQRAVERADYFDPYLVDRSIFLLAYRIGHVFFTKNYIICPELNLTGPYFEPHYVEFFTLPSVGARIYRRRRL